MTALADRRRKVRKVSTEAARLDDPHLDAERADLFSEHFREAFNGPFGGGIGRAAERSDSST